VNPIPAPGLLELLKWVFGRRVRYRVDGDSMLPNLSPGDFVLVNLNAFQDELPVSGDVIVARHPYRSKVLIKRVSEVVEDGVMIVGDNLETSTDSRSFGRLTFAAIVGRVTSRIS